jgi:hypothetical protein
VRDSLFVQPEGCGMGSRVHSSPSPNLISMVSQIATTSRQLVTDAVGDEDDPARSRFDISFSCSKGFMMSSQACSGSGSW